MRVVAFDMGRKNFAFACVDLPSERLHENTVIFGQVIYLETHDLTRDGDDIFRSLIEYLNQHRRLWECADVILVEQQMNALNIHAARLACHVVAYFYNRFPDLPVYEYSASYKTRFLGAKPSLTHRGRKLFAIKTVLDHYAEHDPVAHDWISNLSKKDDVADCILMCATFPISKAFQDHSLRSASLAII